MFSTRLSPSHPCTIDRRSFVGFASAALLAAALPLPARAEESADATTSVPSAQTRRTPSAFVIYSALESASDRGVGLIHQTAYDDQGRITDLAFALTSDNGEIATWHHCSYLYGEQGLLVQIQDDTSSQADAENTSVIWVLDYDEHGRLVSQLADNGYGYSFSYDADGRIASVQYNHVVDGIAESGSYDYAYDASGLPVQVGDWFLAYDESGALESVLYRHGLERREYRYDEQGHLISANYESAVGRLMNAEFSYSSEGELAGGKRITTDGGDVLYTYPPIETIDIERDPSGYAVQWTVSQGSNGPYTECLLEFTDIAIPNATPLEWEWLDLADPFMPHVAWTPAEALVRPRLPQAFL